MIQTENILDLKKQIKDRKAVIFGLDNVIYPLDDFVQSGFRQVSRLFLGGSQEVYDQLWNTYQEQEHGTDTAIIQAIHAMLQQNGLHSDEMAEKCLRIYEQHSPGIQPYDGVIDLLKELRAKGIRLGLLTDGLPEMQREKIRTLGIVPLFDEIIITDDMAGNGDVMKFRTPNEICFEIMSLRLDVPLDQTAYVCCS